MNIAGQQYIRSIWQSFKDLSQDIRDRFTYDDNILMERLMRLWIESRIYELNTDEEHRQIALATLKEDFLNR